MSVPVDTYVKLSPDARKLFKEGVDLMGNLVRPTIGPVARMVAMGRMMPNKPPELLDQAGVIARRTIQLPDPFVDMGFMLMRTMAWRLHDEVGDGSATAVVISQVLLHEANKYVAAGGNPMRLRHGLEKGVTHVLEEVESLSQPADDDPDVLGHLAEMVTGDKKIGNFVTEIYEVIGPEGSIVVQKAHSVKIEREYMEGMQWDSGWLSPKFANDDDDTECVLENARIVFTDAHIKDAEDIIPLMNTVLSAGEKNLAIIAGSIQDEALGLLVINKEQGKLNSVAMKAPGVGERRIGILEDMAIVTGGRVFNDDAGEMVAEAKIQDLGKARRVWANQYFHTIVGGLGDPVAIRERINQVKSEIPEMTDEYEQGKWIERLGKLAGGVGILKIGDPTESGQEIKQKLAEFAVKTVRAAIETGTVPGGGATYLAAAKAVGELVPENEEEAAAFRILARALEEPMRAIAENAGYEASATVRRVEERPVGWGLNVLTGEFEDMRDSGVIDPTRIVLKAISYSVSNAVMALSTEALVFDKENWLDPNALTLG
jgi:chaperonin GroEL